MENGAASYLSLGQHGTWEEIRKWNLSKNTIWACKLLRDGNSLAIGGDFGEYFFADKRTDSPYFKNVQ